VPDRAGRQRALVHVRAGADVQEKFPPPGQEAADVLLQAGKKSQQFFAENAKGLDDEIGESVQEHNVEVITLTPAEYDAWVTVAQKSSYAEFDKDVPTARS